MRFRYFWTNQWWEQSWFLPMDYKPQRDGVLAQLYRRSKILASFLSFGKTIFNGIFSESWYSPKFWESVRNALRSITLFWFVITWFAVHLEFHCLLIDSILWKMNFVMVVVWNLIFNWLKCNIMHVDVDV